VQALYNEAITTGPAALMHFLRNLPELPSGAQEAKDALLAAPNERYFYDKEALSEPLQTIEKRASLACNLEAVDEYWLNKLELGELLDEDMRWAQGSPKTKDYADKDAVWPSTFSRTALYADYLVKCGENKSTTLSSYKFFKRLAEWTKVYLEFKFRSYENPAAGDLDKPKVYRELLSGQHRVITNLPELDKCRKAFEKYAGQKFAWPATTLENDDDEITQRMMHDARRARF
jgi:hypothetical protein